MNLQNATVLVTEANRGIGYALISRLTDEGVKRIYATVRKPDVFNDIASDRLVPIKRDITDRQQGVRATGVRYHRADQQCQCVSLWQPA